MREKTIKKRLDVAESDWLCVAPCPTAAVRPVIQHCWKSLHCSLFHGAMLHRMD